MESHQFWAFFVIALIAGGAITLAISNATMTGHIAWGDFFKPREVVPIKGWIRAEITQPRDGATFFVGEHMTIIAEAESSNPIVNMKIEVEGKTLEAACDSQYQKTMECRARYTTTEADTEDELDVEVTVKDNANQVATDEIEVWVKKPGDCSDCKNVLNMLSKCEPWMDKVERYYYQYNATNCNMVCAVEGKTCLFGIGEDIISRPNRPADKDLWPWATYFFMCDDPNELAYLVPKDRPATCMCCSP